MPTRKPTRDELFKRIGVLEERLLEAEQTIQAIHRGEVDALVIDASDGPRLYTLTGADRGYRVLVESIVEGALILSSDDSIYYCNSTLGEMLGLPIQNIVGRKLDSYCSTDHRAALAALLQESRRLGAAKGELLIHRDEGTLLPVNVSLNHLRIEDFEGICAVITDLSEQKRTEEELRRHRSELESLVTERTIDLQREILERKRMEEELRLSRDELEQRVQERTAELRETIAKLEHLNQELQEFAFIASHDLQEPLRKIQTFANRLVTKHRASLDLQGQDYLDRMTKSAHRMSDLLLALLRYSRAGTAQLDYQPVSLTEVAKEAASDLEHLIERARGSVQIDELPIVEADPALLRQLFQNVIGNAIKYRRESEPPVVKIHGRIVESFCQVRIEDNGIGFDDSDSCKIFKPFERLHTQSSPYGGMGMGLAICRKIVARHGGGMTVQSIPGQGTTFTVTLPMERRSEV